MLKILPLVILSMTVSAHAIILYGGGNTANTSAPSNGAPWSSVAQVPGSGSAVYIGNGYMLTAKHVGLGEEITFDGVTFYQIEEGSVQDLSGTTDLKIFKLTELPSVTAANLLFTPTENFDSETIMVGWGVGRDGTPINSDTVGWGDSSTIAKRWGVNELREAVLLDDGSYSYEALASYQGSPSGGGLGANEAAATLNDSGSGVFQEIDGVWYLIGITTDVTTLNSSHFGNDQTENPHGDGNYSVRISTYAEEIAVLIPEPSISWLLAAALLGLGIVKIRRTARV